MNAPATATAPPVRTTCPYCGVGCGVIARPDGFGGASVQGDAAHPANFGRLCSKGAALGETLSLEGRLLHPMMRMGGDTHERTSWEVALDRVAQGFEETIARYGPDSVAFYVSGQFLTEDYYVANKLMKGFIGSANIDTNSRLCMASSVAGHKRAFGSDTVPGCYEDLDEADLLVLTGSNAAWCHPVLFQRMMENRRKRGARLVVIDPRRTATAEEADLALGLAPGTDQVLFAGLLVHLADTGVLDHSFIGRHTRDFDAALEAARILAPSIDAVSRRCDVPVTKLRTFFDWFRETERSVTLYSQGVNQSAQGTDKVNAIINCHLATGRIGKPGTGPFSLTGQPNAMGGREAGGLANQLAAHMGFEPESLDLVSRFWGTERLAARPGLKAVDLFEAVAQRRIKALWIMATNPAVSMPRADAVRASLRELDLLVVSDVVRNADAIMDAAHVLLPAAAWGEKDGTVTNSERRISRQRAFLAPPGDSKPDWWIMCEVARRMGFGEAFAFSSAADIFREHARLSAFENNGSRDFDVSGLANLTEAAYGELAPVQWPVTETKLAGEQRLFAEGRFFSADARARFVPIDHVGLARGCEPGFPFLLNTGRVRDHWHTMTRTGKSPRLAAHTDEPFVSVSPADAAELGIAEGGFARVTTLYGSATLRARISSGQRPREIFAPFHWTAETSSDGRVGALVQAANDIISGQPELKATAAALSPVTFTAHGFLLRRSLAAVPKGLWWARSAVEGGHGYRLAGNSLPAAWPDLARSLLGSEQTLVELLDDAQGWYRAALIADGRLEACLFLARNAEALPGWEWLKGQLAEPLLPDTARRALLAGRAPRSGHDEGPIVCACFGVGRSKICRGISHDGCHTVEDIGRTLRAGTNCGSCIPELRRIITEASSHATS
ncbi:MAG: molybdopterin-dependent oxidoreductase [Hyphomicrobium sp.]|jgi:assimilatory nitrate reductase catalytic subunit